MLSGGGARAASHIGILKVLEKEQIPIDIIAGTSFGALVGGFYSIGYSADEMESILTNQDWDSIFSDAPQRRLTRQLMSFDQGVEGRRIRLAGISVVVARDVSEVIGQPMGCQQPIEPGAPPMSHDQVQAAA